jgi:hypothetical protein
MTVKGYKEITEEIMNYEAFNAALNRIRIVQSPSEVEDCVIELYKLTDHGAAEYRVTAEKAIRIARDRTWAKAPSPMKANDTQVAGNHYCTPIQHWDYVIANDLGYFEGQITKYITRWRKKNGLQDLHKARHFLEKLIESEENKNG